MKKIIALVLVLVFCFGFAACTKTETYTETNTDENGNTTTTTTTTVTQNGQSTTTTETTQTQADDEIIHADIHVINDLGADITGFYITLSDDDSWGDNIIPEDVVIAADQEADGITLNYTEEYSVWDIKLVDADGNEYTFDEIDFTAAPDAEYIVLDFILEDDGRLHMTIG